MHQKRSYPGIRIRHARTCRSLAGGKCGCRPAYEASVYASRERRKIRKTFPTLAAARAWRADANVALRRGTMRGPSQTRVAEAAAEWLKGAREGTIRTRAGDVYKPSALRGYEQGLRARILPDLGAMRLTDVKRIDVQDLADRLLASGLDPSTIRNALMPLRVIYRRAWARGEVAVNPTTGLELPAVQGRRDRIAAPDEAAALIAALSKRDRALWATVFYAGLRRGELQGLRWDDIDLGGGLLRIERAWDETARQLVVPKSRAGRRKVPIATVLRDHLDEHMLSTGSDSGFVFGTDDKPFAATAALRRARTAWHKANLDAIGFHEGRHTFASLMIAAGVNVKALSSYLGHASISLTLDRYGHLMPGNEEVAARLLDEYLAPDAVSVCTNSLLLSG